MSRLSWPVRPVRPFLFHVWPRPRPPRRPCPCGPWRSLFSSCWVFSFQVWVGLCVVDTSRGTTARIRVVLLHTVIIVHLCLLSTTWIATTYSHEKKVDRKERRKINKDNCWKEGGGEGRMRRQGAIQEKLIRAFTPSSPGSVVLCLSGACVAASAMALKRYARKCVIYEMIRAQSDEKRELTFTLHPSQSPHAALCGERAVHVCVPRHGDSPVGLTIRVMGHFCHKAQIEISHSNHLLVVTSPDDSRNMDDGTGDSDGSGGDGSSSGSSSSGSSSGGDDDENKARQRECTLVGPELFWKPVHPHRPRANTLLFAWELEIVEAPTRGFRLSFVWRGTRHYLVFQDHCAHLVPRCELNAFPFPSAVWTFSPRNFVADDASLWQKMAIALADSASCKCGRLAGVTVSS